MKNSLETLIRAGMDGRSLNAFAREAGIDAGNLSRILKGQKASADVLKKIGEACRGVSAEDLFYAAGYSSSPPGASIPIYGTVAGGLPLYAFEDVLGSVMMDGGLKGDASDYFALRVRGNSMDAAHIPDGSVIVVRKQQTIEEGEIGVFLIGDEATVKKFKRKDEHILLIPQSTDASHDVQIYSEKDNVRLLGVVVRSVVDIPCLG